MADPHNLVTSMGAITELAGGSPGLFSLFLDTFDVQRQYDVNAGRGVIHVVGTFAGLELTAEQKKRFENVCRGDATLAYMILRSHEFMFSDKEQLLEWLYNGAYPYASSLKHLREFIPGFGGRKLSTLVGSIDNDGRGIRSAE